KQYGVRVISTILEGSQKPIFIPTCGGSVQVQNGSLEFRLELFSSCPIVAADDPANLIGKEHDQQ
ncbi:MAG: hypothetical protein RBS57_12620, partial [Desulforhabdus sp.]|nr:hypothetical protein [Desulforhabdus sp.]